MFSYNCSTDEAPRRMQWTLSFFKHQAREEEEHKTNWIRTDFVYVLISKALREEISIVLSNTHFDLFTIATYRLLIEQVYNQISLPACPILSICSVASGLHRWESYLSTNCSPRERERSTIPPERFIEIDLLLLMPLSNAMELRHRICLTTSHTPMATKSSYRCLEMNIVSKTMQRITATLTNLMEDLRKMDFHFITLKEMVFRLFADRWNQIELSSDRICFLNGEDRWLRRKETRLITMISIGDHRDVPQ